MTNRQGSCHASESDRRGSKQSGPRLGPNPIPFEIVDRRARQAFDTAVEASRGELGILIHKLIAIETGDLPHYEARALRELMQCTNDVRGVAQTLGSVPTAEIANAMFELAEGALPDGSLPKPLIALLAQSCLYLIDDRKAENQSELHKHVQALLLEARSTIAGAATGKP